MTNLRIQRTILDVLEVLLKPALIHRHQVGKTINMLLFLIAVEVSMFFSFNKINFFYSVQINFLVSDSLEEAEETLKSYEQKKTKNFNQEKKTFSQ